MGTVATAMSTGPGFVGRRGIGIPDLGSTVISVRVCWLWRMRTDPLQPWRELGMHFSKEDRQILDASIFKMLGDGSSALFWEDRWLSG
jgi:hypothetical protein